MYVCTVDNGYSDNAQSTQSLKCGPEKIRNAYVEFAKRKLAFKTESVMPEEFYLDVIISYDGDNSGQSYNHKP